MKVVIRTRDWKNLKKYEGSSIREKYARKIESRYHPREENLPTWQEYVTDREYVNEVLIKTMFYETGLAVYEIPDEATDWGIIEVDECRGLSGDSEWERVEEPIYVLNGIIRYDAERLTPAWENR